MRSGHRRAACSVAALAATALVAGCGGGEQSAPQDRQGDLPAPVSATVADPAAPESLTLAGQAAPTRPVKTDASGALLPPQNVAELGWWADSALPGSGAGTVVITGHIDEADQGDGFAKRFTALHRGDEVTLHTAGDQSVSYRVGEVQTVNKDGGLPVERLNRLDGPETLALVTCGGPFVGPPLGYRDNIVVWASPESATRS